VYSPENLLVFKSFLGNFVVAVVVCCADFGFLMRVGVVVEEIIK
jgi:DNA-directed RNA polymerase subunit E'/Rpb7